MWNFLKIPRFEQIREIQKKKEKYYTACGNKKCGNFYLEEKSRTRINYIPEKYEFLNS